MRATMPRSACAFVQSFLIWTFVTDSVLIRLRMCRLSLAIIIRQVIKSLGDHYSQSHVVHYVISFSMDIPNFTQSHSSWLVLVVSQRRIRVDLIGRSKLLSGFRQGWGVGSIWSNYCIRSMYSQAWTNSVDPDQVWPLARVHTVCHSSSNLRHIHAQYNGLVLLHLCFCRNFKCLTHLCDASF